MVRIAPRPRCARRAADAGDLDLSGDDPRRTIEFGARAIVEMQGLPLSLGATTRSLIRCFAPCARRVALGAGGLSVRDVITVIQGIGGPLVGADVVEYNPTRDPSGVTAYVAAKLVKEIAARMLLTPMIADG